MTENNEIKQNDVQFHIFHEIIDNLEERFLSSKKKSYKFSLNDILDAFYENEVMLYHSYIDYFFNNIFTKDINWNETELFVKFVWFANDLKTNTIVFQQNYFTFLVELSKCWTFWNEFERAVYRDISSIFSNWWWTENQEYFDIILDRFYWFFNNTLFRNFLVLFCADTYKRYKNNKKVDAFLLDMLSNNRKIHTVLKIDPIIRKRYNIDKHEKKYLFEIDKLNIEDINETFAKVLIETMLKKMNLKWSSLFSNQLRFFWYKRMKFIKNKELTWDNEILELSINKIQNQKWWMIWEQSQLIYWYQKSKNIEDMIENINEVLESDLYSMNDLWWNLHQILWINFKTDKNKYIQFFEYLKAKNRKLYDKIYFYIWTTIDLFYWIRQ